MRSTPTILHLDMDAFFAAVEQASKPSLRGKPVVVGGLGPRGVVATASYEARVHGVHSAMAMAHARRLCPNAAYLVPRFGIYRRISDIVMALLAEVSPLIEPLSLDEAFVDLEAGDLAGDPRAVAERLRADIRAATGLTASVGLAGSKLLAKIASEQAKPDGLVVVEPGTERALLDPLPVRTLWGVGPATAEHLRRAGILTVAEIAQAGEPELVRLLGKAHGSSLHAMAAGLDNRPVVADRDVKSISVEDTFDTDLTDRARVRFEIDRLADRCAQRLRGAGRSGRTVVVKIRRYDFSTLTRSETLRAPTDDPAVVKETARRLAEAVDTTGGVRLLGVGVSGLADFTQEDLFAQAAQSLREADPGAGQGGGSGPQAPQELPVAPPPEPERAERWLPGQDVAHTEYGAGWVQGSGVGRVTVRFEVPADREPGRVRTFAVDDPALSRAEPPALTGPPAPAGRP
ncbi:DNA polymerase IV [Actinacidiphila bryophytorum]|uniref:DNA polymerase IV n=1 Tax=Actinacidiphila bryophytorum TaxID=1436133 RepID=A0A9W4E6H6_9ACTN|nr:DNA polymerase IV [Actinacidiphila bryophytorum]MBM9439101.1 DNA polymerase IV [Actinacidiphila bryophytorum]MBN6542913.1 DNA polymerase IV [Actinacidiphila bryophytorum]CAG7622376.1 DNA polymerase IV [Actinacidiphila bryophytorum]